MNMHKELKTPTMPAICQQPIEEKRHDEQRKPPSIFRQTPFYRRVPSIAFSKPTILKLFPLPSFPLMRPAAGISLSSQ